MSDGGGQDDPIERIGTRLKQMSERNEQLTEEKKKMQHKLKEKEEKLGVAKEEMQRAKEKIKSLREKVKEQAEELKAYTKLKAVHHVLEEKCGKQKDLIRRYRQQEVKRQKYYTNELERKWTW